MTLASRSPLRRWAPAVAWAACIFLFSTGSFSGDHTGGVLLPVLRLIFPGAADETLDVVHAAIRKAAHLTEYCILSRLVFVALRDGGTSVARARIEAVLFAVAYAVTDEIHQNFVPGRTPAAHDVLLDATGALAAQLLPDRRTASRGSVAG